MDHGRTLIAVLAIVGALANLALAGPEDDDPESLASGVIARFSSDETPGVEAVRTSPGMGWSWTGGAPDPRLPSRSYRVVANASLLIQAPGKYTFTIRADAMEALLKINGKVVCEAKAGTSTPVDLRPGFVAVRLEARAGEKTDSHRLAVDWQGPTFAKEALPARLLYHDPASTPSKDPFEDGRRLADRLGCGNCHAQAGSPHKDIGPALPESIRETQPTWLRAWLRGPGSVRHHTRMPSFGRGLADSQVSDLLAYLSRLGAKDRGATAEVRMAMNVASPEKGRLLFRSVGCLGCHAEKGPKPDGLPVAPDLGNLGARSSPSAIAVYLEHPRGDKTPSRHRPDIRLTADESAHVAAYLTDAFEPTEAEAVPPPGDPGRGEALAKRLRCGACHALKGAANDRPAPPRLSTFRPDAGCLANEPTPEVPRFALNGVEREALRAYVAGLSKARSPIAREVRALDVIRRWNCLGCHTRDGQGGADLAGRLAPLLAQDSSLGGLKGTLSPPNLTAVGDKLRPEYLALAITGQAPTARPWLSVRMPVFPFEPGEPEAIAAVFQGHDRAGPEADATEPRTLRSIDPKVRDEAARLIGQRGFGCVSCHVLSGRVPPGGEPETLGPDLALVHRRMSERYFRRWIADPQRIIAGTPMPQFLKPIEGVAGTLDDQLSSLWQLLGSDALAEVAATGTREVLKREGDRALVVRDMVLVSSLPDTPYTPRGLAIGLKNDVSLLFDTDRLGWLSTWRGGFLSRTKSGRLWEWHPEGKPLWTAAKRLPPVVLISADGSVRLPVEQRERFGTFGTLEFLGDGLRLSYHLRFAEAPALGVTEHIEPTETGWERQVVVADEPKGFRAYLVEQVPANSKNDQGNRFTWSVGPDRVTLSFPTASNGAPPSYPGEPSALLVPCLAGYRQGEGQVRYVIEPTR